MPAELSKMREASAALACRREREPLKMTSVISLPRSDLTLWAPSTHLMASTTLDLPEPLGPTTTVMPGGNSNRVRSAKLLKPFSSSALSIAIGRGDQGEEVRRGFKAARPTISGNSTASAMVREAPIVSHLGL